jgi:Beta-eliminating lyase
LHTERHMRSVIHRFRTHGKICPDGSVVFARHCRPPLICRFSTISTRHRVVDLRSDTITSPSPPMLQTAMSAPTGDDVMGEDPTVLELEAYMADMFGKESGLFVPTGSMANLTAIMAHCNVRSSEIIIGAHSHIALWEAGNAAGLAVYIPNNW